MGLGSPATLIEETSSEDVSLLLLRLGFDGSRGIVESGLFAIEYFAR
jgi:hypothetical protein